MIYFLGTCSLTLALIFFGAGCIHIDNCNVIMECPCDDGTTQLAGCTGAGSCTDACSDHGGVNTNGFNPPDAGDGGDGG